MSPVHEQKDRLAAVAVSGDWLVAQTHEGVRLRLKMVPMPVRQTRPRPKLRLVKSS